MERWTFSLVSPFPQRPRICCDQISVTFFWLAIGRWNDVDSDSDHRRKGDTNHWGSFKADQNWVSEAENQGYLQCKPPTTTVILSGQTGRCYLSHMVILTVVCCVFTVQD
jgi:hypothetical protein